MSGALAVLNAVADWRRDLQPASFRGVPFEVNALEGEGGRRVVVFEFPGRDLPFTEDLGRAAQRHRVQAFVIGAEYIGGGDTLRNGISLPLDNSWMAQRDRLLEALQDDDTPGMLVHPTMGRIMARVGGVRWSETKEHGGVCAFEIEFVEDGPRPSPLLGEDTASALLRGIVRFARLAQRAYRFVSLVLSDPLYVLGLQGGLLGLAATALRALPSLSIGLAHPSIDAVSATPGNDDATVTAVATAFDAIATNVIALRAPTVDDPDPIAGVTMPGPSDPDPTGGLLPLARWGADLPPITGTTAQAVAQATQQAATVALIRAHALAAIARIHGTVEWPYAQAATQARTALLALFDLQAQAAADSGQDDLYRALGALESLAMADMTARAQALPRLERYAIAATLPSDVLAWRFYQDPNRIAELEALNNVQHPLFMPAAGLRLSAA